MTALINDQPFVTQLLDGKNGERRQIKVQVSRPELVVQARDSYIVAKKK